MVPGTGFDQLEVLGVPDEGPIAQKYHSGANWRNARVPQQTELLSSPRGAGCSNNAAVSLVWVEPGLRTTTPSARLNVLANSHFFG